jgi:hypothetical protein
MRVGTLLRRQTLRERLRNAKGKAVANSARLEVGSLKVPLLFPISHFDSAKVTVN